MEETIEPTREQIVEWLATHFAPASIDDERAVLRSALRTLDAEKQLAAMTERAEKAERERDEEGRLRTEWGALYTDMVRQRDDWHEAANAADERAEVSRELHEAAERDLAEARAKLRETTQERDAEADCCTEMRKRAKDAERRLAAITPSDDVMSGLRDAVRAYPPTSERHVQRTEIGQWMARVTRDALERAIVLRMPDVSHPEPSPERIDCEASALLLLSTWAKRVMTRPKNRAKGVPTQSILELLRMAWHELSEARWAIADDAPTDDILAELGDAATCIAFAMREIESRRNR